MKITYAPKNILQIDDARIIFRNFSGTPSKFNREGDRNFAVVIPDDETANELLERGWHVIVKPPGEEYEEPLRFLKVKVKFNDRGPSVYLRTNGKQNRLDEESVSVLDHIDIFSVDLDIRPYHWERDGDSGITAYLQAICVTQAVDRFMERENDIYE